MVAVFGVGAKRLEDEERESEEKENKEQRREIRRLKREGEKEEEGKIDLFCLQTQKIHHRRGAPSPVGGVLQTSLELD
jgi:hypothetical protein